MIPKPRRMRMPWPTSTAEFEDALGNEQAAAEAAETAFEFDQAKIGTAGIGEAL